MKAYLTTSKIISINTGEEITLRSVYEDAEHLKLLWRGIARTVQDYIYECLHGMNECAMLIEKIENAKTGKDIIVWLDEEADEIYISY